MKRKKNLPILSRPTKLQMDEGMISDLFKITIICESELFDTTRITTWTDGIKKYFNHKTFQEAQNEDKIKFIYSKRYKDLSFTNVLNENEIKFLHDGNIVKSLLRHLRNAFAHNRLSIQDDFLFIEDYSTRSSSTTLTGKVNIVLFRHFIDSIFQVFHLNQ